MKIANSGIAMSSSHALESHVSVTKTTVETQGGRGLRSLHLETATSESARTINETAALYEDTGSAAGPAAQFLLRKEQRSGEQMPEDLEQAAQAQAQAQALTVDGRLTQQGAELPATLDELLKDIQSRLMRRLLDLLSGVKHVEPITLGELTKGSVLDLRSPASKMAAQRAQRFGMDSLSAPGLSVGTSSSGTVWQRVTSTDATRSESERTSFQSQGFAVTEDGRSIQMDVSFTMSRSFTESYTSFTTQRYVMTDPLIINLDSNETSVTSAKFQFDLDGDGQEEEISFAGEGSGFLALDRDGNGKIDDGSELFGTKSGDGFADLAAYDEDGNHWIDENDAVYSQLRVWTRDASGKDRLLNLKEANVGAIYLGNIATGFSLNDEATNATNAVLRKTGVYLRETGETGTLSHVDLCC